MYLNKLLQRLGLSIELPLLGLKKRRAAWKLKLHEWADQLFNGKPTSKAPVLQLDPVFGPSAHVSKASQGASSLVSSNQRK